MMPKPLLCAVRAAGSQLRSGSWRAFLCSTAGQWIGALVVLLAAAEATSRIDDAVFTGVPLLAAPDRAYDLTQVDDGIVRGRPGGRYRKWALNNHGFPGPDIAVEPAQPRIMLLGSSETFGLYESKGHTYPELLGQGLKRSGRSVEVVNAALPGMSLPSARQYWLAHASRFRPDVVLIYAAPEFYLDLDVPAALPKPAEPPDKPSLLASRFAGRLYDQVRQIGIVREFRGRAVLAQALAAGGPDFLFGPAAPADRLAAYRRDLETLADTVAAKGSVPVLVTYAFKSRDRIDPRDAPELEYFRIFYPRAEAQTFLAFSSAARQAVLEIAQRRGWPCVDAADALSGQRELFADPVHFNDKGSQRMADVLTPGLVSLLGARGGSRAVQ